MTAVPIETGQALDLAAPLSAQRRRVAGWAMAVAFLLHLGIAAVCIIDWSWLFDLALSRAEEAEAIPVTLVYLPPPPPPAPKQEVQPPPDPAFVARESGADAKTEAKAEDAPQPALPEPRSPPPEPASQPKKQTPPRVGDRQPATVAPPPKSVEQEALAREPKTEVLPGELFHSIRLPSQHGGTGERDTAGDAYLNRMKDLVERHRIYPPVAALGAGEHVVVLSILIEPGGSLVQITTLAPSGSSIADEAAGNMIRNSAPFPPIPANYPHIRTLITVEMPIYSSPRDPRAMPEQGRP